MAEEEDAFELDPDDDADQGDASSAGEEAELDEAMLPQRPLGESDDDEAEAEAAAPPTKERVTPAAKAPADKGPVPTPAEIAAVLPDVAIRVAAPASLPPVLETTAAFVAAVKATVAAARATAGAPSKTEKGRFCVLLITPSAPRAASLCGLLSRGGVKVAKLFARHLTIDEQGAFLSTNDVDVGVGTPNRLARLADAGMLNLATLRYVVIDVTPDAKAQVTNRPSLTQTRPITCANQPPPPPSSPSADYLSSAGQGQAPLPLTQPWPVSDANTPHYLRKQAPTSP